MQTPVRMKLTPQAKCSECRTKFAPRRPLQTVCSLDCAIKQARKMAEKKARALAKTERAAIKVRKEKIKKPAKWADECRAIVQKIARLRDRSDGCISCDLPATWGGQWHGSHFRSHGAASAVQFNLWNIHKSCSACNLHKSGNIIEYRPRLIAKIGQEKVDWLMAQNQTVKLTTEYYVRFKKVMGKRLRMLEKRVDSSIN